MNNKHQVHNLIILDESGSMESIKKNIIRGFNEIVQTIKGIEKKFPEQEHFISLISFNGLGNKLLHFIDPVSKLKKIDDARYQPDSSTPLFDALGFGINKLKRILGFTTNYHVLVTILTDGEENASMEFSGKDIAKLIGKLKQNRWTFTYIGTDHEVEKLAASISITNTMSFSKDIEGMENMFLQEANARIRYSQRISERKEATEEYYK